MHSVPLTGLTSSVTLTNCREFCRAAFRTGFVPVGGGEGDDEGEEMNARENRQRPLPSSRAQAALARAKTEMVANQLETSPTQLRVSHICQ